MSWGTIVSVFLAIPKILEGIRALVEFARTVQREQQQRAVNESMEELRNGNQIPLERAIGSERAGKPSGLPGTEFRDTLPDGVSGEDKN